MKKTLLLALSGLFSASLSYAQPTLTSAANPVVGTTYKSYACTLNSVGAAGANITWDYSTLVATDSTVSNTVACSATPNCGNYPGSNVVQISGGVAAYLIADASKLATKGFDVGSGQTIVYSNPEDYFHYPFTYGNTYTDAFSGTFTSGVTFYRSGTITVTADAYGTLKLPNGVYNDVLRIKIVEDYKDSSFAITLNYLSTIYNWVSVSAGAASTSGLLSKTSFSVNGVPTSESSLFSTPATTSVKTIAAELNSFTISPNPAATTLSINLDAQGSKEVGIALYDMTGRQILHRTEKTGQTVRLDVSTLPKAMYLLKLSMDGQSVTKKVNVI